MCGEVWEESFFLGYCKSISQPRMGVCVYVCGRVQSTGLNCLLCGFPFCCCLEDASVCVCVYVCVCVCGYSTLFVCVRLPECHLKDCNAWLLLKTSA